MIQNTQARNTYTGNGSSKAYNYLFKIFAAGDITVIIRDLDNNETQLIPVTDYFLSKQGDATDLVGGINNPNGGAVNLVDNGQDWLDGSGNLKDNYVILIMRKKLLVQETSFRNQGPFFPAVHEDALDKLVMIDQQQQDQIDKSVRLPETESTSSLNFDLRLPYNLNTPNASLAVNEDGDGFKLGPSTTQIEMAESFSIAASASANAASASESLAEEWATKTDDFVTGSAENSAKSYAIGGTGDGKPSVGSAKDWAVKTDGPVDTEHSAKEWARGTQTRGAPGGGSAKDWANYTGGTVDDSEFSAKQYATEAQASAAAAADAAAASLWNDVVFVTHTASPIAITEDDRGKLYVVDTTGGAVTVNLPEIDGLNLSVPWSVGVKKSDASANAITINAHASDEIRGGASVTLTNHKRAMSLIPDTDPTPDRWTVLDFGAVPTAAEVSFNNSGTGLLATTVQMGIAENKAYADAIDTDLVNHINASVAHGLTGSIVGTTDTQTLTNKTLTAPVVDVASLTEQSATPSTPGAGIKKFYAKNDGLVYTLDSSGAEVPVGSTAIVSVNLDASETDEPTGLEFDATEYSGAAVEFFLLDSNDESRTGVFYIATNGTDVSFGQSFVETDDLDFVFTADMSLGMVRLLYTSGLETAILRTKTTLFEGS